MNLILLVVVIGALLLISVVSGFIAPLLGLDRTVVAFGFGILALIAFLMDRHFAAKNSLPKCEAGVCGPGDFSFVGAPEKFGFSHADGSVLQCKCGKKYLERRNRLLAIDQRGEAKPYKVKRRRPGALYATWTNDETANHVPVA